MWKKNVPVWIEYRLQQERRDEFSCGDASRKVKVNWKVNWKVKVDTDRNKEWENHHVEDPSRRAKVNWAFLYTTAFLILAPYLKCSRPWTEAWKRSPWVFQKNASSVFCDMYIVYLDYIFNVICLIFKCDFHKFNDDCVVHSVYKGVLPKYLFLPN